MRFTFVTAFLCLARYRTKSTRLILAVLTMTCANILLSEFVDAQDMTIFRQVPVFQSSEATNTEADRSVASADLLSSITDDAFLRKRLRGCVGPEMSRERVRLEPLDATFASQLGDRFASTVLPSMARENKLDVVLDALRVDTPGNQVQTFVVSEFIRMSDASGPAGLSTRRAVLSFTAQPVRDQVMLSTSFGSTSFRRVLAPGDLVEVWAWDENRGVLNFYEWNSSGMWTFVGSSQRADDPPAVVASNRCIRCHRSGAPVMKELRRPWNNWDSSESPQSYLRAGNADSWPVAPQLSGLTDAAKLEASILTITERFNRKRVEQNVRVQPDSSKVVQHARFLLRPLFVEQEFNLVSSRTQSGNSPFDSQVSDGSERFTIPASFFIRQELLGGSADTGGITGLGIQAAKGFAVPEISLSPYASLVEAKRIGLLGKNGTAFGLKTPADTDFAWLTPVRSYVDDHVIDRLIKQGVVTREFVAAVCHLDLKTPVFSKDLAELFATPALLPDTFVVPAVAPTDHRNHPLTAHVLSALSNAATGSVQERFTKLLDADNPVGALEDALVEYNQEIQTQLTATDHAAALESMFDTLISRRKSVIESPDFRVLDETLRGNLSTGLLPLPIP